MSGASGHFLPLSMWGFDFPSPGGWRLEAGEEDHTLPGGGGLAESPGSQGPRSGISAGRTQWLCSSLSEPWQDAEKPDSLVLVMALVRARADTFPGEGVC